ncbi:uncharacterized protein PSFLO_02188 [Pseudozyma flocculosa]|uniref:Uncharacterized protein n=1 Tax=Pseudozyma flocculosa TaxID=84751 RepID=A0A5C3EZ71_9BASI|nr:uncharacterized protein PSFLO_02188 [Pseudozyma flocculosa]
MPKRGPQPERLTTQRSVRESQPRRPVARLTPAALVVSPHAYLGAAAASSAPSASLAAVRFPSREQTDGPTGPRKTAGPAPARACLRAPSSAGGNSLPSLTILSAPKLLLSVVRV